MSPARTPERFSKKGAPFLVELWIGVCAFLACTGWVLSIIGQLNAVGYSVALLIGLAALWKIRPQLGRVRVRRFRRIFPCCFLLLALLAILGGAIHPPSNYDGLAYRIPRVLHWLAAGNWHWIHTDYPRLNVRATGWEWIAAPILALSGSYRWLFLINAVAFILMPGLVFSTFTRLGVRPRVAWHWMWLAPTGYCFLLQAGSISNDMLGAVFSLAAVDFALRSRASGKASSVWLSGLSAALLTASKLSNLPLLLPWAICLLPALPALRKRVPMTLLAVACAAGASLLPISVFNEKHLGEWTGVSTEFCTESSWLRLPVNGAILAVQNLVPPVFPMANAWNEAVRKRLPERIVQKLEPLFEIGSRCFTVTQMDTEESAGLGFGLSLLLLITASAGLFYKKPPRPGSGISWPQAYRFGCLLAPWVSLLVVMHKSGLYTLGRVLAPYYMLLMPAVLVWQVQSRIHRARWWRSAALGVYLIALLPLVASPARPLWPARSVLAKLDAAHSQNPILKRAYTVYSVYGERSDGFAPAVAALPPDVRVLGFVSYDDPEAALWKPFGSRRIEHLTHSDTPADLRAKGIEYILVSPERFPGSFTKGFDRWAADLGVKSFKTIPLTLRASDGVKKWELVRLPPND